MILGAGFAASSTIGVLLTVALAVEYLFVGLFLSAVLAGTVRRRTVAHRDMETGVVGGKGVVVL